MRGDPTADLHGGVVAAVSPGSPADHGGIRNGDHVLAVDDAQLADAIDWLWHSSGDRVSVTVATPPGLARMVELERQPGEAWGIDFAEPIFDAVRTCTNDCVFCFMSQLPPGLRPALYVRDDDFRLSFTQGNYITLTNLVTADVDRIVRQRLSPLYVSLHAVEAAVRERLICTRGEDRAVDTLESLLASGIEVHVQIVLVPDVNDGAILEQTLSWLDERTGVLSVGIVPVGYTRFQTRFQRSYEASDSSVHVIDRTVPWQESARATRGATWVYLADEFYVNAGRAVPPASEYDGFPQYENGIGLVRSFEDDFRNASTMGGDDPTPVTLVTGEMFAGPLGTLVQDAGWDDVRVLGVANRFFGGNVGVTGLLVGADITAALRHDPWDGRYLLPDAVLNDGRLTLDDMTFEEVADASGSDLRLVSCDATALVRLMCGTVPTPPES